MNGASGDILGFAEALNLRICSEKARAIGQSWRLDTGSRVVFKVLGLLPGALCITVILENQMENWGYR